MGKREAFRKPLLVSKDLQPPDRATAEPSGSGRGLLGRVRAGNKQPENAIFQSMAVWGIKKKKKGILHLIFKMAFKRDLLSGDSPHTGAQGGPRSGQTLHRDFFHGKEKGSQSVASMTTVTRCGCVFESYSDPNEFIRLRAA